MSEAEGGRPDAVDVRLRLERAAGLVSRARGLRLADPNADPAPALALCSAAIGLAPTSAEAHLERSRARLAAFRRDPAALAARDGAVRDARRAAFIRFRSWRCALQASRALGAAGEPEAAARALGEAEALARADDEGEGACAVAFALCDQRGRLRLEAAKAAKAAGAPEQRWMWLLADAVGALDAALRAHPHSADTLNNRGVAYFEARSLGLAAADFASALALEPANDRALSNRALVERAQHRLAAAHASLTAALARHPASAISHNNLGCVERDLGRPAAALLRFARAAELDPAYGQARANRDALLAELRQPVPIRPADDYAPLPGAAEVAER